MKREVVTLEILHTGKFSAQHLGELIAQRAWNTDSIERAELLSVTEVRRFGPAPQPAHVVTITAAQIARENNIPLHKDEHGREYVDSRDFPPEGGKTVAIMVEDAATAEKRKTANNMALDLKRLACDCIHPMTPVGSTCVKCGGIVAGLEVRDGR